MNKLEKFIMDNEDEFEEIFAIANMVAPIRDLLPNFESYIFWLCELDDEIGEYGFFNKQYGIITKIGVNDYFDNTQIKENFINEFDSKLEEYSIVEKPLFTKILLTLLIDIKELNYFFYEDANKEKTKNEFKFYSIDEYWDFYNAVVTLESLITYYTLVFNRININLPFKIIDKIIMGSKDENEGLSWYIQFKKSNIKSVSKEKQISRNDSTFKLSKSITKIEYIRILNAISELRYIQNNDGTYPTKQELMVAFGNVVGLNLSTYTNDLNKSFNTNVSIEQNCEIFDKLKNKTIEIYNQKQDKQRK